MPKSPLRRKSAFTPPQTRASGALASPRWLAPVMVACFVLGLLWLVTWYVTQREYPIHAFGVGNMGVGFGLILVGFMLATRWK